MFILFATSYDFLHTNAAPSRAAYPRRWPSLAAPTGSELVVVVRNPRRSPMRKAAGECGTSPREGSLSGATSRPLGSLRVHDPARRDFPLGQHLDLISSVIRDRFPLVNSGPSYAKRPCKGGSATKVFCYAV